MTQAFYSAVCVSARKRCMCVIGRDNVGFSYKYQMCHYCEDHIT